MDTKITIGKEQILKNLNSIKEGSFIRRIKLDDYVKLLENKSSTIASSKYQKKRHKDSPSQSDQEDMLFINKSLSGDPKEAVVFVEKMKIQFEQLFTKLRSKYKEIRSSSLLTTIMDNSIKDFERLSDHLLFTNRVEQQDKERIEYQAKDLRSENQSLLRQIDELREIIHRIELENNELKEEREDELCDPETVVLRMEELESRHLAETNEFKHIIAHQSNLIELLQKNSQKEEEKIVSLKRELKIMTETIEELKIDTDRRKEISHEAHQNDAINESVEFNSSVNKSAIEKDQEGQLISADLDIKEEVNELTKRNIELQESLVTERKYIINLKQEIMELAKIQDHTNKLLPIEGQSDKVNLIIPNLGATLNGIKSPQKGELEPRSRLNSFDIGLSFEDKYSQVQPSDFEGSLKLKELALPVDILDYSSQLRVMQEKLSEKDVESILLSEQLRDEQLKNVGKTKKLLETYILKNPKIPIKESIKNSLSIFIILE